MTKKYIKEYMKAYVDFMQMQKTKSKKHSEINKKYSKRNIDNYLIKSDFEKYLISQISRDNSTVELIIEVRKNLYKFEKIISKYGEIKGVIPTINSIGLETDGKTAEILLERDSSRHKISLESKIKSIEASNVVNTIPRINLKRNKTKYSRTISDPKTYVEGEFWNLNLIGLDEALEYSDGSNVKIGIIDTGIDYTHKDLKNRFGFNKGYDFVNNDNKPMDENGHGTHVAGIVSGKITGISRRSRLYSLRVLDEDGSGTEFDVMRAIEYALKNNYDIVNMSLGGSFASNAFERLCEEAYNKGLIMVAAAGNEGYGPSYPAAFGDSVISVAAVDSELNHASFSNIYETTDISAPGVDIYSTYLGGAYEIFSGTSMATPHVTGSIALYVSIDSYATPEIVNKTLNNNSQPLSDNSIDYDDSWIFGAGLVRADLIMQNAESYKKINKIIRSKYKKHKRR